MLGLESNLNASSNKINKGINNKKNPRINKTGASIKHFLYLNIFQKLNNTNNLISNRAKHFAQKEQLS